MKYLIIVAILFHLPFFSKSQTTITDSVYQLASNGSVLKIAQQGIPYVAANVGDSIITKNTSSKKRGLLSITDLKTNLGLANISGTWADTSRTNIYAALGTKQNSLGFTPYNATNPNNYISSNQSITLSGDISGIGTTSITTTIGNAKVSNGMLAGSIDYSKMNSGTVPTWNQNTSGTSAGLSTPLSFANGGNTGSAATSATTGTINVSMTTSIITCTPSGNMTLNATGGVAGQIVTFSFTTSGVSSFTITFGTNFRKTGTLATGTTSARFFTVTFRCLDGTTWTEISRTAVQT